MEASWAEGLHAFQADRARVLLYGD
jgi:hypothetical protein